MPDKVVRTPRLKGGLSARLLLLTVVFVMLAEVMIYLPTIGRFWDVYLKERLADAHLAVLALDATPGRMPDRDLEKELLNHVGVFGVALVRPGKGKMMLMTGEPGIIDSTHDLRAESVLGLIGNAAGILLDDRTKTIRVIGESPKAPGVVAELILRSDRLREEMLEYSTRIFWLSLAISIFTATLLYISLFFMVVRPMRRMTQSMIAFREAPEDLSSAIRPSARADEIGVAERELVSMQEGLRAALQQKTRLAALGTAVTKINHDLKNILATALLVSDRLRNSEDPDVRHVTPTLVGAVERAVKLCGQTLRFTREGPAHLEFSHFDLRDLVEDVGAALPGPVSGDALWCNALTSGLVVRADREQLHRVLGNLGQNAIEAGAKTVTLSAERDGQVLAIDVDDDGPGLAPRAAERLFQPFAGSARPDGTGLGLAIARDLMRAHGGDIRLKHSTAEGCCFRLILPLTLSASREGIRRLEARRETRPAGAGREASLGKGFSVRGSR